MGNTTNNSTIKYTKTKAQALARPGNPTGKAIDIYGFSLAEVSRGIGVHNSTISRIFSAKRRVSLPLAARICAFVGITLERLNKDLYLTPKARVARKHRTPLV